MSNMRITTTSAVVALGLLPGAAFADFIASNGNGGSNPGWLLSGNETTGAGTLIGDPSPPGGVSGLSFNGSGALFGSTISSGAASTLIQIDPGTGALISSIGTINDGAGTALSIGDLSFQPGTGILFGIESNSSGGTGGRLWTISTTTAVATLVGDTGTGAGGGLAFAANGTLYHTGYDFGQNNFSLNVLDTTTGAILSSTLMSQYYDGLGVRKSDGLLFAATGGVDTIYTIDAGSGTETPLGASGTGRVSDIDFASPVPEPFTLGLAGLALGAAARRRMRRRSN